MSSIKEWSAIVCICAVISCLVDMLAPSGRMDKAVRFVLGAFMLCSVFIPLINTVSGLSTALNPITSSNIPNELEENVQESFSQQASYKIETIVAELLKKNNVEYKKINVLMDINKDFSISIIKINVYIDRLYLSQSNDIKKLVEDNLGIETQIELS